MRNIILILRLRGICKKAAERINKECKHTQARLYFDAQVNKQAAMLENYLNAKFSIPFGSPKAEEAKALLRYYADKAYARRRVQVPRIRRPNENLSR